MERLARTPRYQQLADTLRDDILRGAYGFGARLPSEPELCQAHGVSRGTVVRAFELLVNEGLAHRRQGAGTFVARASLRRTPGALSSFTETIAAQGLRAGQQVIDVGPAGRGLGASVGCFEPATRMVRLRFVDGERTALHTTVVPDAVLSRFRPEDAAALAFRGISDFSLYAAFARAGCTMAHATETLSARLATETEAEALERDAPLAVMLVARRSFDAEGRLIEATEAIYRGDGYAFEAQLVRPQGPARIRRSPGRPTTQDDVN